MQQPQDFQQQQRGFRQQLKQQHRMRLGLGFCDDNAARMAQLEAAYRDVRGMWEAEARHFSNMTAAGVDASTTDNEQQTIGNTLANNRHFWSSTGSLTQIADEALLYELQGPAAQVHFVQVAVYRAFYQHGYPVYPPMQLQVWTGPSPSQLQPASPVMDVQATDALQTFALHPDAPVGSYLQLRLFGKLQKQREDMQFYIAIRHVSALGTMLPAQQLVNLSALLRSGVLVLNPGGQLPGSCCAALDNMLGWGLGPLEASKGLLAGGRLVAEQQQQQQNVPILCLPEVVARHHQQQQHPEQQEQEQQPHKEGRSAGSSRQQQAGGGFWSVLGTFRRRGGKPGDAAAGSSSSSSMQIDGAADSFEGASSENNLDEGTAAASSTSPRWLLPAATGAGNNMGSSRAAAWQQCWRTQHPFTGGNRPETAAAAAAATAAAATAAMAAVNDTDSDADMRDEHFDDGGDDGYDVGHLQQHAGGAAAGGAAAAAAAGNDAGMEIMFMAALHRLEDPDDLEHVLAAWLQDEPLTSAAPAAFDQPTGGNNSSSSSGDAGIMPVPRQAVTPAFGSSPASTVRGQQQQRAASTSSSSSACQSEGPAAPTAAATAAGVGLCDWHVTCQAHLQASTLLRGLDLIRMEAVRTAPSPPCSSDMCRMLLQDAIAKRGGVTLLGDELFQAETSAGHSTNHDQLSWFEEGVELDLLLT